MTLWFNLEYVVSCIMQVFFQYLGFVRVQLYYDSSYSALYWQLQLCGKTSLSCVHGWEGPKLFKSPAHDQNFLLILFVVFFADLFNDLVLFFS